MRKTLKRAPAEYQLILSRKKSEDVPAFVFTLRTVKEFRSFQYLISVETEIQEKEIRFGIKGLQTPGVALPRSGPATFSIEFPHLIGRYEIVVSKSDGEENSFLINVRGESVTVEKAPEKKFVELVVQL